MFIFAIKFVWQQSVSMMEFRTKVEWPAPALTLSPQSKVTLIGSCFAVNVGQRMQAAMMDVHVNPFGVLYNPLSIAAVIKGVLSGGDFSENHFFESNEMWHCWLNDSSFSEMTKEGCMRHLKQVCVDELERLFTSDVLFITLGTNHYYNLKESGLVVGNCHKQPSALFEEKMLTVEDVVAEMNVMLHDLWAVNPALNVVWTVSPYRYQKYGLHESQLGKAVLLLAVDRLCRENARCSYFPAYEIVLDELRDYRFYNEDMLHPSAMAVSYIWECFCNHYFTSEMHEYVDATEKLSKALAHRPLHPDSESYRQFLCKTLLKLEQLNQKYPNFVISSECRRLKNLIKS